MGFDFVDLRTTARSSARAMARVVGSADDRIFSVCTMHWASASATCRARPPVHFDEKK